MKYFKIKNTVHSFVRTRNKIQIVTKYIYGGQKWGTGSMWIFSVVTAFRCSGSTTSFVRLDETVLGAAHYWYHAEIVSTLLYYTAAARGCFM